MSSGCSSWLVCSSSPSSSSASASMRCLYSINDVPVLMFERMLSISAYDFSVSTMDLTPSTLIFQFLGASWCFSSANVRPAVWSCASSDVFSVDAMAMCDAQ